MPGPKLNRYKVTLNVSGSVDVYVDALDEDDADEMILDGDYTLNRCNIEFNDVHVVDIEQVKSDERVSCDD